MSILGGNLRPLNVKFLTRAKIIFYLPGKIYTT